MKRSEVDQRINKAIDFAKELNVKLPPFAFWTARQWREKGPECDEIRDLMLGWDVTDFGFGEFFTTGRTLFTLRNGSYRFKQYPRMYSEKQIFIEEDQVAPIHFHRKKTEDIINRGGGNIIVEVCKASEDGSKSDESFYMSVNGCKRLFKPSEKCCLTPGESILIPAGIIHEFWSEKGTGMTLSGEVGSICDDLDDNIFLSPCERFTNIEEDEEPLYVLCNEYANIA